MLMCFSAGLMHKSLLVDSYDRPVLVCVDPNFAALSCRGWMKYFDTMPCSQGMVTRLTKNKVEEFAHPSISFDFMTC